MRSDIDRERGAQIGDARLPPLTALRCFEAAARLESFSRAADTLHLTHGAVSRAVRLIEDDLGTALFERRSRRVFLTEAGRRLAAAVRDGFDRIGRVAQEIRQQDAAGPVTLSCEPTLLMRWLIPRLPSFHAAHPDIALHLVAAGGPVHLGNGIDLAIRRSDFPLSPGMHGDILFDERIGPVCRADMIDRFFDRTGTTSTLRADATVLHTRTRPDAWATWAMAAGVHPPAGADHRFEHFYLSLQAASAGIGVAIGAWQMVRDDIANGTLAAPLGFADDGSRYVLLSTVERSQRVAAACGAMLEWVTAGTVREQCVRQEPAFDRPFTGISVAKPRSRPSAGRA
jgi:DNA-binding transcriptional LysR family regulator